MTNKQVYTKNELLEELKRNGLPSDYTTLLRYERSGIVSKPKNYIELPERSWRIYSASEIADIVKSVRRYRKHLARKGGYARSKDDPIR
jgi:hypothetical protein